MMLLWASPLPARADVGGLGGASGAGRVGGPGGAEAGGSLSAVSATVLVGILIVLGAVGAGLYIYSRSQWRRPGEHSASGPVPLPELDADAQRALVATDDAVRTSAEELGFATAEFGAEATERFADALAEAEAELTAAFRIRQALDDGSGADSLTRRSMLAEIVDRCHRANARLDAEVTSFDRLRALVRHAPQALATAGRVAAAQRERLGPVMAVLEQLRTRYAESAVAPLTGHPEQIADRLAFADDSLGAAGVALAAGDKRRAAVLIRAAEASVEQAQQLLDAIDRRAAELDTAEASLPAALAEMESDLADAEAYAAAPSPPPGAADLAEPMSRARQTLAALRAETVGRHDPIDVLRRTEEADALLAEALNAMRGRQPSDRRFRSLLAQATLTARSEIDAAEDFVTTRRGAVGSPARTRLAEAKRLFQQSAATADGDPTQALTLAHQADVRARQALATAQADANRYHSPYEGRTAPMGGAALGGIVNGDLLVGGFGGGGTRGRLGRVLRFWRAQTWTPTERAPR